MEGKVDILYVVGKGFSEWNDNELRYSLRCIAKNGINVGRVFVVGHCPYWLNTDEVTCLPLRDPINGNKHYNILTAIEYAIEHSDISENFLYSSDDHFYVQPTDFAQYPVKCRAYDLPNDMPAKPRWYDITMKSTHDVCEAFALPICFYAWHGNTWFNTRLWNQQRMVLLRRLAKTMRECCDPTCLMLNYWEAVEPQTMPRMEVVHDAKISAHTIAEIKQMAKEKEVLSTTDAVAADMREWLMRNFPKRCKYERN